MPVRGQDRNEPLPSSDHARLSGTVRYPRRPPISLRGRVSPDTSPPCRGASKQSKNSRTRRQELLQP